MSERTVIQSIPKRPVVTISPRASVFEAASLMTQANCGSVVIVDGKGAMLGIFTERDLMIKVVAKALSPEQTLVMDVMTGNPRFAPPDMTVSDAVMILKEGGFRHLPIISAASKLIGVFSIRDASPYDIIDAEDQLEYLDKVSDALGY